MLRIDDETKRNDHKLLVRRALHVYLGDVFVSRFSGGQCTRLTGYGRTVPCFDVWLPIVCRLSHTVQTADTIGHGQTHHMVQGLHTWCELHAR